MYHDDDVDQHIFFDKYIPSRVTVAITVKLIIFKIKKNHNREIVLYSSMSIVII